MCGGEPKSPSGQVKGMQTAGLYPRLPFTEIIWVPNADVYCREQEIDFEGASLEEAPHEEDWMLDDTPGAERGVSLSKCTLEV